MSSVHVGRLTIQAGGASPWEAGQMARRVAELLGQGLGDGTAVRPRRDALIDVQVPPSLSGERLAEFVAREIRRHLR
jgi:hypothetical protein